MTEPELTDQQAAFVRAYTAGLSPQQAAQKANYSSSYARKASKLLKHPEIANAIEATQAALRESQGYGPTEAVREINKQIAGALTAKSPNHMAAAKLLDLKCRIFGLVREKVEIATVDLRGALEGARERVLRILPVEPATRPIDWTPRIPGTGAKSNP